MGTKKARAKDKPAPKPRSLRKQLRRAEADLGKATAKRDRAQARVDAMSIIADEIRAQLAEAEKSDTADKDAAGKKGKAVETHREVRSNCSAASSAEPTVKEVSKPSQSVAPISSAAGSNSVSGASLTAL